MPKISICIPTFNRSDLLKKTLNSVARQTVMPFEVIIVDNCSTDDTQGVSRKYTDFTYYRNETNLGMIGNWNRCINLAKGDYITILHSDDIIVPSWVEEWSSIIGRNYDLNIGAFFSAAFTIDERNRPKIVYQLFNKQTVLACGWSFKVLWKNNMCGLPASGVIIFRKSIFSEIGKFEEKHKTEADVLMSLRILNNYSVYYTPKLLFAYRVHPFQSFDNKTETKSMNRRYEIALNHLNIFKEFYNKELRPRDKSPLFYKRVALMYASIAVFYIIFLKWRRSIEYFRAVKSVFPDILNSLTDYLLLLSIIKHYTEKIVYGRFAASFLQRSLRKMVV